MYHGEGTEKVGVFERSRAVLTIFSHPTRLVLRL
jgi:hypothetical protein